MDLDNASYCLILASFLLTPIIVLIVGSQTRDDARSIALWTLCILLPILLVIGARLAASRRGGVVPGGPGLVAICAALIASVEVGYWIARSRRRPTAEESGARTKTDAPWDDEIDDHFAVVVPTARAINPISKSNWEGTGVPPDMAVPADRALDIAHVEALEAIAGAIEANPAKQAGAVPLEELKRAIERQGKALDEAKEKPAQP